MAPIAWIVAGGLVFFGVLYFVIKGAVEEGTYNALMNYKREIDEANKKI